MNSTKNIIQLEYMNELFYQKIGSPNYIIDSIYLYLICPFGILCFVLNFITFLSLQSKQVQKTTLNSYIKIYVFVSCLICLLLFIRSTISMPRYFEFSYNIYARIFLCQISPTVTNVLNVFSNLLNIITLFERLSKLEKKFERFRTKHPNRLAGIIMLICMSFNIIPLFILKPKSENEFNQDRYDLDRLNNIEMCQEQNFGKRLYGKFAFGFLFLINNVLVLMIEVIVTIFSIKYLKIYINLYKKSLTRTESKKFVATDDIYELTILNHKKSNINDESVELRKLIYELNNNLTRMIISLSLFSTFSSIISLLFALSYFIFGFKSIFFYYTILIYIFVYLLKHGSNFLILIMNNSFRASLYSNFRLFRRF